MNFGVIGRSKYTFDSMIALEEKGHKVMFIITSKEAPEYNVTQEDFRRAAQERNVPFLYSPNVKANDVKKLFGTSVVDVCISVNYTGVIAKEIIDLFPFGILNAHGGDLPRYRGNACQAWAIINGEERVGLCVHKMIGGELDSGVILARSYYPLIPTTRIGEIYDWFTMEIPRLYVETLANLSIDGSFSLEHQSLNPNDALRCYPRLPEDGRIKWESSAIEILRLINATSEPYSGAFTTLDGTVIHVWRADIVKDHEVWCGIPGQVSKINDDNSIDVLTGNGKIRLNEIEIDGFRMSPAKVIRSIRVRLK